MSILKEDDEIDKEFDGFVRKLITYMMEDARTIFNQIHASGFNGPISLIYGDTDSEWQHIDQLRDALNPLLCTAHD